MATVQKIQNKTTVAPLGFIIWTTTLQFPVPSSVNLSVGAARSHPPCLEVLTRPSLVAGIWPPERGCFSPFAVALVPVFNTKPMLE